MNVTLKSKARQFVEQKVRSGQYASAEQVVEAGLAALRQQEAFGDFKPGELDQLIEEGERSSTNERTYRADEVFAELRKKSQQRRAGKTR
jgi:putative addiction module CopG family antidote